ncbi:hypothetical protein KIPB_001947, partial [Kipferlia bialata]|eukprot:g1947.t1
MYPDVDDDVSSSDESSDDYMLDGEGLDGLEGEAEAEHLNLFQK